MNANRSFVRTMGVAALALALAACSSSPETATTGKEPGKGTSPLAKVFQTSTPVTVPEGTEITVVTDQAISTADNRSGEEFDATVATPVVVQGKTVIAKGSRARGRIVESVSSGRLSKPARLELTLVSVESGGTTYDIDTSDTARSSKGHKKRNIIFIGGGTAAGALLGGILGGGKGAAIGAAAGAGGGTAAAAATGKKEIRLPAETRLSFTLSQPVTIKVKD
ncbi:MAG TPA: hypothetical protein VGQ11_04435 [Candidatus Acidoferrales bacterium]|nr:hypothetical protein [Candidatus Acidoferrales bacterium]